MVYNRAGSKDFPSLEALNSVQGKPGQENTFTSKLWRYCMSSSHLLVCRSEHRLTLSIWHLTATTKLQNILWVAELQRRLDAEGTPITVMAVHPGTVYTGTSNLSPPS